MLRHTASSIGALLESKSIFVIYSNACSERLHGHLSWTDRQAPGARPLGQLRAQREQEGGELARCWHGGQEWGCRCQSRDLNGRVPENKPKSLVEPRGSNRGYVTSPRSRRRRCLDTDCSDEPVTLCPFRDCRAPDLRYRQIVGYARSHSYSRVIYPRQLGRLWASAPLTSS